MSHSTLVWVSSLLVCGLLLTGCEGRGTPPDVPAGRYEATVTGTLTDTLRGLVHRRMEDGALTGLELGAEDSAGLSIQLQPEPLGLRTYEIVEAELFDLERSGEPPGAIAFLELYEARFEATEGHLEVTYLNDRQIGAQFRFLMEGSFERASAVDPTVEVTGSLNAPAE